MTAPSSSTIEYKTREHIGGWEVYRLTTGPWGTRERTFAVVGGIHEAHNLVEQLTHETQDIMRKLAHQLGGRIENNP